MSALNDEVIEHLRDVVDLPDLTGTRYQVIRRLDRGGMGTIYLVKDIELGRELALKVLSAADPDGDLAGRLVAEARHLARLEHPNIVPVHDVGRLPDGRVYYTMKLVRGQRLDAWREEAVGRPAMLRLFQKVCGAVAFAHSHGVIHRDLKPENIMVGSFGEALVMDWGVAKRIDPPTGMRGSEVGLNDPVSGTTLGRGVTARGAVIGTPAWMSPEQARGESERLDARSDVWALGAILYFLLAGRPPYAGETAKEVIGKARQGAPTPLRRLDDSIPRALEAICAKAMAAEPDARYASAQQMADDVERHLDGLSVSAHRERPWEKALRFLDRNRALAWLVLAYVVVRMVVLVTTGR